MCLVILILSISYAQAKSDSQQSLNLQQQVTNQSSNESFNYFDLMVEQSPLDIERLNESQKQLAEAIYQRAYGLYSDEYHQQRIDRVLDLMNEEQEQLAKSKQNQPKNDELLQCQSKLNQLQNYKGYIRLFAYGHVYESDFEDAQNTLNMLNHFFVDEIAQAREEGNDNFESPELQHKVEQQGLIDAYEDFLNDSDYEEARNLTSFNMDSIPDSAPNAYPFMTVYFVLSNNLICERLF
ncbi:hypothetical protein A6J60_000860 [Psychrobacter sp. FDAARGOS_221]|nr:hypothetical protein A6J60_000860 [Psychrobacter sp. FDAARGOS_221]